MQHLIVAVLCGTLVAGTPLIFAGLGELVAERAGVLNLGVEGMMLIGAVIAFGVRFAGFSPAAAIVCGAAAGAAASLPFGFLALTLAANQIAAGLALAIVSSGVAGYLGHRYGGASVPPIAHVRLGFLSELPVVGPVLFAQDPMVYVALASSVGVWGFLYRSKAGLVVRSIGESPQSAYAMGYPVTRIRYAATLFGGAMAGLGGSYLSVCYTPLWAEDMTAGRGWIALALVVFAAWQPARLVLGAWLFGGLTVLQLFAQGFGVRLPSQLLSSLPYLATIVVLVAMSRNARTLRLIAPPSLGQPFRPEH